MATVAAAAARRAAALTRLSSPQTSSPHLIHRRGLAGAADSHGPPRVNIWQDPLSPSKWKEEHFVIASLSGWGLLFFSGYKLFSGGKDKKEEIHLKGWEALTRYAESGGSITLSVGACNCYRISWQ
uniref:Uncharacterized protein n=1 Tax=Quercus lobata TaxID=97700 RepID=A0A7N2MRX4_QUELO